MGQIPQNPRSLREFASSRNYCGKWARRADDEWMGAASPVPPAPRSRAASKIVSHERLLALREQARTGGQSVVQCHGCFDIVHPGHIRHLRQAKAQGDVLLVSITSDEAWTKRHGAPLIPEELRAENLAELDCVDWVYIERRPTAQELLAEVKPDVYVKGKEYEQNNDPRFASERRTVEEHGGRVVFSSGDVIFSSTALIQNLERSVDPYHAQLMQLLARPALEGVALSRCVGAWRGKRVLVVGETILDTYVLCDQPEVAGESPVLTLRPIERRQYDGGAAIIARHVAAMGGHPTLLTALPATSQAAALQRRLEAEGVRLVFVPLEGSHATITEKQRYLVGAQKVMKVNNYQPITLDAEKQDRLVDMASVHAEGMDAAIVADFGNGLLGPRVLEGLSRQLRPRVGVLTGDVSGRRAALLHFHGFDLLAPCEAEARHAMQCFDESLPVVAWRLLQATRSRHALLTLGAEGLVCFEHRELPATPGGEAPGDLSRVRGEHVPALVRHPIDPLGCGDTLLAAATLALTTGASPLAAAFLGSLAAAAQAQRLGNAPISAADVREGLARLHAARLVCAPGAGFNQPAEPDLRELVSRSASPVAAPFAQ